MKNLDFRQNPITTLAGILLILVSLFMMLVPFFMEVSNVYTEKWYIPLVIFTFGVVALRSPDTFITGANKAINKFSKNEDNKQDEENKPL